MFNTLIIFVTGTVSDEPEITYGADGKVAKACLMLTTALEPRRSEEIRIVLAGDLTTWAEKIKKGDYAVATGVPRPVGWISAGKVRVRFEVAASALEVRAK